MLKKQRIIAFILAFKEKPLKVLKCLSVQTMKPDKVVIVAAYESACVEKFLGLDINCLIIPPDLSLTVGERVGISLSIAFKKFKIEGYDYMIKLDDDIIFDKYFIEENVEKGYDLMGRGAGMIIKVKTYMKFFDHIWPISAIDDTHIVDTFLATGCRVLPWSWARKAILKKEVSINIKREFLAGRDAYRLGYPFLVILLTGFSTLVLKRSSIIGYIARIGGYIAALLTRPSRYWAHPYIARYKRSELVFKLKNLPRLLKRPA